MNCFPSFQLNCGVVEPWQGAANFPWLRDATVQGFKARIEFRQNLFYLRLAARARIPGGVKMPIHRVDSEFNVEVVPTNEKVMDEGEVLAHGHSDKNENGEKIGEV
ncbi:MAG: hypothetical protein ABIQ35_08210 [Verrucomicrobiota bacterium]